MPTPKTLKEIKVPLIGTIGSKALGMSLGIVMRAYIEFSGLKSSIWGFGISMFPAPPEAETGSFRSELSMAIGRDDALLYALAIILIIASRHFKNDFGMYFGLGFLATNFITDITPFMTLTHTNVP